jgi:biotin carboxyl carrier protein
MPSQIVKILVTPGQEVQAGDPLIILSSMKMENTLTATTAGKVEEIYAQEGANVAAGFLLLQLVAS